jgi:hypothetical protein
MQLQLHESVKLEWDGALSVMLCEYIYWDLTFWSLAVSLRATRFNVKIFYLLLALCVLCGSEDRQRLLLYTTLTDWFYNRGVKCLQRGTDWLLVWSRLRLVFRMLSPLTTSSVTTVELHSIRQTVHITFPHRTHRYMAEGLDPSASIISTWYVCVWWQR